jgi:DNA primase
MEVEGIGYLEALKYLANKYSIAIEEEASAEAQQAETVKDTLYAALTFANRYFQDLLHNSNEGKSVGLGYFRERGFSEETIQKFELGYSAEAWDGFLKAALKNKFTEEVLEKAGLILVKEEGKKYDRFRGRVMFPIHNISGRVIGFGARMMKKDDKQPKYLNSPESEVYHKSDVLYGIYHAKKAIRTLDNCYLVEGYTDVISMHQAGVENAVASSGTSLTEQQVQLIKRFTDKVTVLYDGDAAGIKASVRGIDMLLEAGLLVRAVVFPDGHDPDSYVRSVGPEAFKQFLKAQAKDFILFKTELFLKDAAHDPIQRGEAVRSIVQSIAKVPDAIQRAVFYQQCAQLLGISEELLVAEGNQLSVKELERKTKQQQQEEKKQEKKFTPPPPEDPFIEAMQAQEALPAPANDPIYLQEAESIRLLIEYGSLEVEGQGLVADYLISEMGEITFSHPVYKRVFEQYKHLHSQSRTPTAQQMLKLADHEAQPLLIQLLEDRFSLSHNWMEKHHIFVPPKDQNLSVLAYKNLLHIKYRFVQRMRQDVLQQLQAFNAEAHIAKQQELMQLHQELKHQERELAKLIKLQDYT